MNRQPDDPTRLAREDLPLVETLRTQLDPGERSTAQRAAFRARLDERLEARARPAWRALALAGSAAVAALALWLAFPTALPADDGPEPTRVATTAPGLLAYAYYETDYLGDGASEPSTFLSDEYQAIAVAFEVP